MTFKERRKKHDDAHYPLGGKGARATRPKVSPAPCPHTIQTLTAEGTFCSCCGVKLDNIPLKDKFKGGHRYD